MLKHCLIITKWKRLYSYDEICYYIFTSLGRCLSAGPVAGSGGTIS